ncbi:MAG: FtsB family cell division protein [Thermoanaerobaculia bacterium]
MTRLQILRRVLLVLACVFLSLFTARSLFSERGLLEVAREQKVLARLRGEVDTARARNAALAAEIADLKTGEAAVERLARERLGYIRQGETTYLFPEESSDSKPLVAAGH